MSNRQFKGIWIPAEIWLTEELSLQEKVMLVEIDSLQDPIRGCYKSNSALADFFQLSKSRVSEIISSLAAKGWITVDQIRDGKQCVERRIFLGKRYQEAVLKAFDIPKGYSENGENPIRKTVRTYSENGEESNTLSNTDLGLKAIGSSDDKPTQKKSDSDPIFEQAWKDYPKRSGSNPKNKAISAWNARKAEGVKPETMLAGVRKYAAHCLAKGSAGTEFVMQAARFFGKGEEYLTDWPVQPPVNVGKPRHKTQDFASKDYSQGAELFEGSDNVF
jgi:hypothetical protein